MRSSDICPLPFPPAPSRLLIGFPRMPDVGKNRTEEKGARLAPGLLRASAFKFEGVQGGNQHDWTRGPGWELQSLACGVRAQTHQPPGWTKATVLEFSGGEHGRSPGPLKGGAGEQSWPSLVPASLALYLPFKAGPVEMHISYGCNSVQLSGSSKRTIMN